MWDKFYLCAYQHWKMHDSTMKTCGHVSSRDIKSQTSGKLWGGGGGGEGLRNNEFCLHGLISTSTLQISGTKYRPQLNTPLHPQGS